MVQINFNAAAVKPNAGFEPVPTGQYPVMIIKSEEKPTKAGTGSYIELVMQIQDGEYKGKTVTDRLNIKNPNQTAVDIAYSTLSAICHVVGALQLQDTTQLHGRPFIAMVSKIPRDDQPGNFSNEVKGYKDINGNEPGFAGNGGAQASAAPAWANNAAPQQAPAQAPVQQPQQAPQVQQVQQPVQQQTVAAPQVQQQAPVQQQQQATQPPTGNAPPPWVTGAAATA